MGMRLLARSFSSFDGYVPKVDVEPKADFFVIEKLITVNTHVVAVIRYPNCTNFEGKKVLVFRNTTEQAIRSAKLIDPHFSKNGLSPFARFIPSEEGLKSAIEMCEALN